MKVHDRKSPFRRMSVYLAEKKPETTHEERADAHPTKTTQITAKWKGEEKMKIGGIAGANNSVQGGGMNPQMDSVSRNLKNQIANAQKELRDLSSNEDMTAEEKMKKKQEIQQEIANLNQQLRQHQMEQRRQQSSSGRDTAEGNGSAGDMKAESAGKGGTGADSRKSGLSQTSMRSMLSADSAVKQAKVQGSVAAKMDGKAGVLRAEIKQDGGNAAKEAELAEVEQKGMKAESSQLSTLAKANREMEEAAKTDPGSRAAEEKRESGAGKAEEQSESGARKAGEQSGSRAGKTGENSVGKADGTGLRAGDRTEEVVEKSGEKTEKADEYGIESGEISGRAVRNTGYVHVDIRL